MKATWVMPPAIRRFPGVWRDPSRLLRLPAPITERAPIMSKLPRHLLWMDLETTGLDFHSDKTLEIGAVITTDKLEPLDEFHILVDYPDPNQLPEFVREMHQKSGLLADLHPSRTVPDTTAWTRFLRFVRSWADDEHPQLTLAGNGVSHFEVPWLRVHCPRVLDFLTYYQYDISTFRRVFELLRPDYVSYLHEGASIDHRALPDIYQAIDEAIRFREAFYGLPQLGWEVPRLP